MTTPLQRLLRQGGTYALGNALLKLSGLLLAPLYLNPRWLSAKEYGYLILLEVTAQVGMLLAGAGVASGLLKYLSDVNYRTSWDELPFSAWSMVVLSAGGVLVLIWIGARPLTHILLSPEVPVRVVQLMGIYVFFKALGAIPFAVLRSRERAGWFVVAQSLELMLLVAGVYYFLVVAGEHLIGVMKAYLYASAASAGLLLIGMLRMVRPRIRMKWFWPLVRVGFPIALAGFATLFLNMGDRYLLRWLAGTESVAVYGWAAKFSGILNMLFVQSFQLAFAVIGLKKLSTSGDLSFFQRTFRQYALWTGWAVLGLSLVAYDMTRILSRSETYLAVETLTFPIAAGFLFYGLYYILANVLFAREYTRPLPVLVLLAALFNAGLNLVLIPVMGALGAAIATLCSYALLMVLTAWFMVRRWEVSFPWLVPVRVLVVVSVLFLVGHLSVEWSVWFRLGWRLSLILSYPFVLMVVGLLHRGEVPELLEQVRQVFRTSSR